MSVILVFVDGVGLGEDDATRNAFIASPPPVLGRLFAGRPMIASAAPIRNDRAHLLALDACLGVAGTPQSGTGQTALLTGRNAAAEYGRHYGPWVPSRLRPLVRAGSLLKRARDAGRRVAFANAYPEEVLDAASGGDEATVLPSDGGRGRARRAARYLNAGPPLAALGAGVLVRHTAALEAGDAVASEITNDAWRERLHRRNVPVITAHRAGLNLARIASAHDLTLFAHYATDYAGHTGSLESAAEAIHRFDEFLGGLIEGLPTGSVLVVASDHGNLEDCTAGHTLNPAIALAVGAGLNALTGSWTSITDVAPAILRRLGIEP